MLWKNVDKFDMIEKTHFMPVIVRTVLSFCLVFSGLFPVSSQDLKLGADDLRIENSLDGGFDLYIRKKPGIESVMLVESTEDPARKVESHALRNPAFHSANGNERRLLKGVELSNAYGYYIVDSTASPDPALGEIFHLFIPTVVNYGFPWSRNGELMINDGTYLNVRTFEKPYADSSERFTDNPFIIRVTQKPLEGPPEGNYMKDAVEAFTDISARGRGGIVYSTGEEDIVEKIDRLLEKAAGDSLDLVIALDATDSMKNDMPPLREKLPPLVESYAARFKKFRIGMVYYRDYFDEYLFQRIPFESTTKRFSDSLQKVVVRGGRDIPEAVFEALYAGVTTFDWEADTKLIILIGDAPPHPKPRGKITEEMVFSEAEARGVQLHTIILPQ